MENVLKIPKFQKENILEKKELKEIATRDEDNRRDGGGGGSGHKKAKPDSTPEQQDPQLNSIATQLTQLSAAWEADIE